MSERVFSPQPVTQYNPITGEVRKESEKSVVDDNPKHNPKVTSKVSDESVKESVKVPVVKKSVKASSVVTDKLSSENQDKIDLVANKCSSLVANKVDVVVKKSVKASSLVTDKFDVVKDKVDVVADKASDALKNKLTRKGKKPIVVVAPVIDNVPVATETDKETEPVVAAVESVVEKHNPKVTNKVSDDSVKVPVVKKSVKASSVVTDKLSSENQDKIDLVANKRSSLVADKVDVVADKASDALKNKLTGKGKKPVVGKDKDKPKNIAQDVVKEKFKPNPKQKKDVSDSEIETDVVDYSSDEADRKRKKLKIMAGLKRKRSGSYSSDSLEIDTKSIKLLISKLEKKAEKEVSDEESLPKKGNKKLTKVKKEESDEDSISKK
nr:hypothetical protein [Tanacetum cinerariifolium]